MPLPIVIAAAAHYALIAILLFGNYDYARPTWPMPARVAVCAAWPIIAAVSFIPLCVAVLWVCVRRLLRRAST